MTTFTERHLIPQNIEAEMCVLGGILLENNAINQALEILQPEEFYRESHRKIFRGMIDLSNNNEPCDLITLTSILKKKGDLESAGGAAYLSTLVDFVPTASNIAYYCRLVRDASVRRTAQQVLTTAQVSAADGQESISEILEKTAGELLRAAEAGRKRKGPVHVQSLLSPSLKNLEDRWSEKGPAVGIPSGLAALDARINGFRPGDFVVIAARPSMGKTALALNIAVSSAMKNVPVTPAAIFSLEMDGNSIVDRFLSACGGVDSGNIRTGRVGESDWSLILNTASELHAAPIWIDDSGEITVNELRSKARRLKAEQKIGILIVDYLQLMRHGDRHESRQQEISEISRALKALAKELEIPVIALSQLNRSLENRSDKRPMMSDLRESGAIEQDADLILFIYREAVYCEACKKDDGSCDKGHEDAAEIIIGKQRNGPIGTVRVKYDGRYTRFVDRGNT